VIPGDEFQHLVLSSPRVAGPTLHVYLDGDGTPSVGSYPAVDPTPRAPLVLDLMTLDAAPAIYVGRPCYHGLSTAACSAPIWTSARYSEPVVASMAAVVRRVVGARDVIRVVWIGYSGGGVLATLLATRIPQTVELVTIAANLDVDAWSDYHGMPRLSGSLNPARQPAPAPSVRQRHYAGGRDEIVPVSITRRGAPPTAQLIVIADYDHRCCWVTLWPSILATLTPSPPPRSAP
jgi:pimeloyl-ACP methyl ester carboxylesterase